MTPEQQVFERRCRVLATRILDAWAARLLLLRIGPHSPTSWRREAMRERCRALVNHDRILAGGTRPVA